MDNIYNDRLFGTLIDLVGTNLRLRHTVYDLYELGANLDVVDGIDTAMLSDRDYFTHVFMANKRVIEYLRDHEREIYRLFDFVVSEVDANNLHTPKMDWVQAFLWNAHNISTGLSNYKHSK